MSREAGDDLTRARAPPNFKMRFAHLKINHRFERMRLRGLTGARDEFYLAAIVQNLKTLANYVWRPPPDKQAVACVT